jgi:DNA-binding MarR family transcriptional regulator
MPDITDSPDALLSCTCFKLRKATRALSRVYDQHMAEVGLKTTQYSVLANAARGALPVADLADKLGLERTTLTRNLRPLIEAGWIAVVPGADSRQRIVTITDPGRAKVAEAYTAWCGAQGALERLVGRAELSALHGQIDAAMDRITPLITELRHADHD